MNRVSRCLQRGVSTRARSLLLSAVFLFGMQPLRTSRAQADSNLTLHWVRGEGAEGCLSGKELQVQLDEALGAQRVEPAALTIEGLIQRDAHTGSWRARLRVLNAAEVTLGTRELSSSEPSCSALTPSIVLVLALMVELGSGPKPAQIEAAPAAAAPAAVCPVPAPATVAPAQPASADTAKSAPKVSKEEPQRWQAEPLAALTLALGLLPGTALGPQLGLRVHSPWPVSLLVQGGYWPSASESIDTPPGAAPATLRMSAYHGDLSLCLGLPRPRAWWLAGCWGVAVGARQSSTSGLDDAASSRRPYAAASAMAQFGYAVTRRLSLAFNTSFLGFTREDTYSYEDARGMRHEVFRASRFAGLLALGLGVRL